MLHPRSLPHDVWRTFISRRPFPCDIFASLCPDSGSSISGASGDGVWDIPMSSCPGTPAKVHVNQHRHSERNLISTPSAHHISASHGGTNCFNCAQFSKFVVGLPSHHKFLPPVLNSSSLDLSLSSSEVVANPPSANNHNSAITYLRPSVCTKFPPRP